MGMTSRSNNGCPEWQNFIIGLLGLVVTPVAYVMKLLTDLSESEVAVGAADADPVPLPGLATGLHIQALQWHHLVILMEDYL